MYDADKESERPLLLIAFDKCIQRKVGTMGMGQVKRPMEASADCWRRFCFGAALALGAAVMLAGCGTQKGGEAILSDEVLSRAESLAENAYSSAAGIPADSMPEESSAVLWTEESVPAMEEWAASALPKAEAGDAKEQAEEFTENVNGLFGRLNQIREEMHTEGV